MIEDEASEVPVEVARRPKKPVPLPRRNLQKVDANDESDGSSVGSGRSGSKKLENLFSGRGDWKTATEIMQEKKKMMKCEVQKIEKSVRSIISKRRSVHPKSSTKVTDNEFFRSNSLPDDNIFCSISFNSPLSDESAYGRGESKATSESDLSSNDGSYYVSDLPPPYPPPDLPDESTYDEATSVTSSDGRGSLYLPSSETNSLYEDLAKYQTADSKMVRGSAEIYSNLVEEEEESGKSNPWSAYDASSTKSDGRYEVIDETVHNADPFSSIGDIPCQILQPGYFTVDDGHFKCRDDATQSRSPTSSVVDQFDPLSEKQSNSNFDLMSEIEESFESMLSTLKSDDDDDDDGDGDGDALNPFADLVTTSRPAEAPQVCLVEGHYGKVRKLPKLPPPSAPPPIPPRRFDSVAAKAEDADKPAKSSLMRWSSVKRVARIVAENIESRTGRSSTLLLPDRKRSERKLADAEGEDGDGGVGRSADQSNAYRVPVMLNHSGVLYKSGGTQRWGVLSQRKLTLFANKDSPDVKETVSVDSILSLKAVNDKLSADGPHAYCFEVSLNGKSQSQVFGAPSPSERHIWMRKLLESVTPNFSVKLMSDYAKAGVCYAKEGITGEWTPCSILLSSRTLYLSPRSGVLSVADLRKARYLTLQSNDETCDRAAEKGPMLVVDMQDRTLYLQMENARETRAWESAIGSAALENGPSLADQQLTKDDIPTIVDKCVNFIHTHGTMSEGIYRRNGSNQTATKLLSAFRSDAWSVQLTTRSYNEFDVSSVLKRFFRDLSEPLFVSEIHSELRSIIETHADALEEKVSRYGDALRRMPRVNYATARRLIGHLYFVDKQKERNLMCVDNLSAIWGPTLLHVHGDASLDANWSRVESLVLGDLITHYPRVFDVDQSELDREMKILRVLESYHSNTNHLSVKRSGDLKMWIHVGDDECVNISVSPQKTSGEICRELCHKLSRPSHLVCLEEVVCCGALSRPLHHSERILDAVLRWGYWSDSDRRDNRVALRTNDLFRELAPLTRPPVIFCDELKFADQKSKMFRSYQFEFAQAKLSCYKDKSCSLKVGEWKIEDIVWYLGHEPKRNPHARWSITFMDKRHGSPRSKERPFFGNTICGTSEEQKMRLVAAMLSGQYPEGILPSPNLIE